MEHTHAMIMRRVLTPRYHTAASVSEDTGEMDSAVH